jgi:hypothetical protein
MARTLFQGKDHVLGCDPSTGALSDFYRGHNTTQRELPLSDPHHRSNDIATHFIEKVVSVDGNSEKIIYRETE